MRTLVFVVALLSACTGASALGLAGQTSQEDAACSVDAHKFCAPLPPGVQPDLNQLIACGQRLVANKERLHLACKIVLHNRNMM